MIATLNRLFAPIRRRPLVWVISVALLAAGGVALAWYLRDHRALARGRAALARQDFAAAREQFESYLSHHPDNVEVRLLAAQAARRAGDLPAAEEHLFTAQRLGDVGDASTLEWALLRAQRGDSAGIESYLHQQEGRDPHTSALVLEAVAQGARESNLPLALDFLDRLLKLQPDHYLGRLQRGRLWHDMYRFENARADLTRAVELRPEGLEARLLFAENAYQLGHDGEAATNFERVLREAPDDAAALLGLARCRADAHELDDAGRLLAELLARHPNHPQALIEQGRLFLRLERPADAEASLTSAPPDVTLLNREAMITLEQALQMQGKFAAARKWRERRLGIEAEMRRQRPKREQLTQDGP